MKSAESALIDFLRSNPSKYASAELQRMIWKNKNGTTATARSIVRRLEENAEDGGILKVSYDEHGNAWYQIKEGYKKPPVLMIDESLPPIKDALGRWRPQMKYI